MKGWQETGSHSAPAFSPGPMEHARVVILERVDATIGLRLATRLLEADYRVFGRNVEQSCRPAFEAAGGQTTPNDDVLPDDSWVIDVQVVARPEPELISRMIPAGLYQRRPRVELAGSPDSLIDVESRTLVVFDVRPAGDSESVLHTRLVAGRRGSGLIVSGNRDLFEQALPLLTSLSDRVLYATG